MMNTWKLFAVCAFVLAASVPTEREGAAADAETTYTVKLKPHPDAGKSVAVKRTEKTVAVFKAMDLDGKVLNENKQDDTKENAYIQTTLEKGPSEPKKFKRTYEKAVIIKGDNKMVQPFHGRTVVYELKDNKYEMTAEGKPELTEMDLKPIHQSVGGNAEDLLAPKLPLKVNGTWKIDVKGAAKLLGDDFDIPEGLDLDKSKAEGKLLKVYTKNGKQFGVLEMKLVLAVKTMKGIKFDPPALFDFDINIEAAIDGATTESKSSIKATVKGNGTGEFNKMKLKLSGDQKSSTEEEVSAEK